NYNLASMETKSSLDIQLPPGFRFHPSDEELILYYLKNKITSSPLPASVVADIDLYKYNPWELPKKALFGEDEWYFFTPRDRKYPNGARPNRAAASGYWKATGTDRPVLAAGGASIGVKKALVFYEGRPPRGIKTDWIMHEYRLLDTMIWNTPKRKGSMRLDDWVLCRVRQKSSIIRNTWEDQNGPNYEPAAGYLPKMNNLHLLQANPNPSSFDMVKNYLYNDFPMLPYIFASSRGFPCINEASSNISFQTTDSYSSSTRVYSDNGDGRHLQAPVASFDSFLNPLKRKFAENFDEHRSCIPPSKKLTSNENMEDFVNEGIENLNFGTDQPEGNNFSPAVEWNSLMQHQ
ncbi:hypothetical protein Tsubulata_005608, partial [Turnera subulata]